MVYTKPQSITLILTPPHSTIRVVFLSLPVRLSLEEVVAAAQKVAALLQGATHVCAFTGAGISTSAGIGDYRGKQGKWTQEETGVDDGSGGGIPYEALRPT